MERKYLKIDPRDNVAVLLENADADDSIALADGEKINLLEPIGFGHKVALKNFAANENVTKYGENIGYCMVSVKRGAWIHNHNMGCRRGK